MVIAFHVCDDQCIYEVQLPGTGILDFDEKKIIFDSLQVYSIALGWSVVISL